VCNGLKSFGLAENAKTRGRLRESDNSTEYQAVRAVGSPAHAGMYLALSPASAQLGGHNTNAVAVPKLASCRAYLVGKLRERGISRREAIRILNAIFRVTAAALSRGS